MTVLNAARPAHRVNGDGPRDIGESFAGFAKSNGTNQKIIQVVVVEIGAGRHLAQIDGENICRSHQPFVDSARVLLKRGFDPNIVLAMFRPNETAWALRATIGYAGRLTVDDYHGTRFAPWKAYSGSAVSALVAQNRSADAEHRAAA